MKKALKNVEDSFEIKPQVFVQEKQQKATKNLI